MQQAADLCLTSYFIHSKCYEIEYNSSPNRTEGWSKLSRQIMSPILADLWFHIALASGCRRSESNRHTVRIEHICHDLRQFGPIPAHFTIYCIYSISFCCIFCCSLLPSSLPNFLAVPKNETIVPVEPTRFPRDLRRFTARFNTMPSFLIGAV